MTFAIQFGDGQGITDGCTRAIFPATGFSSPNLRSGEPVEVPGNANLLFEDGGQQRTVVPTLLPKSVVQ